jgi:hypothetical protein
MQLSKLNSSSLCKLAKMGVAGIPDRTSLELLYRKITKQKGVHALDLDNFIGALEELFTSEELKSKIDEIVSN